MAKARIEFAAVVGCGVFPFDMLRYDFCSPAKENPDSYSIGHALEGSMDIRVVVVKRIIAPDVVGGGWTPARWASFGWRLIVGGTKNGFEYEEDARRAGESYAATERMHNQHMRGQG